MTRKKPGAWPIQWPQIQPQKLKDYSVITSIDELRAYITRCKETGLGGFDYETSGDRDHRKPPKDADGNPITDKALDAWTKDVNLDPWKAEVCAMSLSADPNEARAIFIDNPGSKQFEPGLPRNEARKRLFDVLEADFFTSPDIIKIAVNMPFETKFTAKYGKYILMPCADPFLMWIRMSQLLLPHKIKNPKRPYTGKGLKPMTKDVFGVQMNDFNAVLARNNALFFDEVPNDSADALSYCCEDSDYAVQHYLYWNEIAKQIPNNNPIYADYSEWLHAIEMPFTRVTGLMEFWGMRWDSDVAAIKLQEAEIAQEEAATEMQEIATHYSVEALNIGKGGKTKDVKSFIFDTLKLPAAAWSDKTKDPSLDSNALMDMIFMLENKLEAPDEERYLETPLPEGWEQVDPEAVGDLDTDTCRRIRIAQRPEHPNKDDGIRFLRAMQKIQKFSTLISSHIEGREKYVNPITGRIHAHYEPWTETGRLSSSNPNGQNVPRPDNDDLGIRNFYKAADGMVLLLEDESGFELRLTAWASSCEVMLKAFENHEDLHRKTAATMQNKPESEITKHERNGAKAANFGSVYGGTEHALQKTFKKQGIRKSLPECKALVDAVMKTYPGIPRYQKMAVVKAREDGYAETIFGYKRLLPYINSGNRYDRSDDERRAQNTPIQGSAADIMKKAQNAMYEKCGLDTAYFNTGLMLPIWNGFDHKTLDCLSAEPFMYHDRTRMVAQIHDEIIVELVDNPALVQHYANWQKAIMEIPPLPDFPVALEAEASVAYSWGNKEDLTTWVQKRSTNE
jgi:DNA polymerase-1